MIHYIIGDATYPLIKTGTRVIAHVCNDIGKWGAGFSGALSVMSKDPEVYYKSQFKHAENRRKLGSVQWVFIDLDLAVVNMIAQSGVRSATNPKPIKYDSLEICLDKLAEGCGALISKDNKKVTVHMPRIACGLAGGSWDIVEPLIEDSMWGIDVYIYDLEK